MRRHKRGFIQGKYTPRNPEKYVGNVGNILYRSSWELDTNKFLDFNVNVLRWASEPFPIPYIKPTDGKIHYYYPDYWVEYKTTKGKILQEIWEVKPLKQTKSTSNVGKSKKQQLIESVVLAINRAKWKAAEAFCKKNKIKFKLITERQLGHID